MRQRFAPAYSSNEEYLELAVQVLSLLLLPILLTVVHVLDMHVRDCMTHSVLYKHAIDVHHIAYCKLHLALQYNVLYSLPFTVCHSDSIRRNSLFLAHITPLPIIIMVKHNSLAM
jgi:hypothetical protein